MIAAYKKGEWVLAPDNTGDYTRGKIIQTVHRQGVMQGRGEWYDYQIMQWHGLKKVWSREENIKRIDFNDELVEL